MFILITKFLKFILGFKGGKENNTSTDGKRQRKPAAPPSLIPEHIEKSKKPETVSIEKSQKNESKPQTATTKKTESTKQPNISRKRKLSSSKNEPVAKKCKKVSTATGGTPKKYASEPHSREINKRVKKVVEVKMAEDGTHNPDRLLYHVLNNQPIANGEHEAEESYDWAIDLSHRQIDDFLDLNQGEKALMKFWNTHLHKNPCYGDRMLIQILAEFIDQYGLRIYRQNLQKNLMLHLSNLHDFAAISSCTMLEMINRFQNLVKNSLEHPDKYPMTPEKVPIDNPYYKPKPLPLESLNMSEEEKQHNKNQHSNSNGFNEIIFKKNEHKQKKSFWVKKSVRKNIVKTNNNEDEEDDLKIWPRKKACVTFANELFIDEVRDINDNSSLIGKQSNFISDFNDMYKFTLISPRRNRRSKS